MAIDVVPDLARRYALSEGAVRLVFDSLRQSGGTEARFDHPELGGAGRWAAGACLVGEAGDSNLQRRVAGLTAELAAIIQGSETAAPAALSRAPGTGAASSRADLAAGESWWPESFGHPTACGDAAGLRFAYFPDRRRLLVQTAGRIDAYDTADNALAECRPDPHSTSKLVFVCAGRTLHLHDLQRVPL